MRISFLSFALLPVALAADVTSTSPVLRGMQTNTTAANTTAVVATSTTGLVCNVSMLAAVQWKSDDNTYRDCTFKLAAAVGSLTSGDTTSQGLSEFCTKCGTSYDARAATFREGCKKKTGWVKETDRKLKRYSNGLDAFGCTKTAATGGDFCAKLYADAVKGDFAVPASCPFYNTCCFGLYTLWADVNTTQMASITAKCPAAAASSKATTC